MKPLIVIFCACLLAVSGAQAQSRWQLSLSGGISVPTGKFGSKNISDSTTAFAKSGPVIRLGASFRITKHWGVAFLAEVERHAVDGKAVDTRLEEAYPPYRFFYSSGPWKLLKVMPGVYGEWPLDFLHRWSWTAGVYVGSVLTSVPDRTMFVTGSNYSSNSFFQHDGALRAGGTALASVGLHYLLGSHFFVEVRADLSGAWILVPTYTESLATQGNIATSASASSTSTTNPPPAVTPLNNSYVQPLSAFQATAGIGIRL